MSCIRIFVSANAAFWLSFAGPAAHADGAPQSPSCRRMLAEARSEASLLSAPRITAQGLRVPDVGDIDGSGTLPGDGLQVRTSLAVSPLDMYRGTLVVDAARAECDGLAARDSIDRVLAQGASYGRGQALRAQVDRIAEALPRVDSIVGDAERRLVRQVATAADVDELRRRRLRLRRTIVAGRQELALLEAQDPVAVSEGELSRHLEGYERSARKAERLGSRLRRLSAWRVDLRGGAIPDGNDTDWFGMVEVTYNLGGLWQRGHEKRYLRARNDELATARAEAREQLRRFAGGMRDSATALREELSLIDEELAVVERELTRIEGLASERANHARAVLELDRIELGAQRAFVVSLIESRDQVGGAL